MGRAERRLKARRDRIDNKKNSVTMSRDDIRKMKQDISDEVSAYSVEALMTCFALANRRLYGHGPERTMRTLQYIDDLMGHILDGSATIEDFKRELKDETGVSVQAD